MSGNTIMLSTTTEEPQYLKVKDKKHDWSNQKLLHHFQHAKNQLNYQFILEIKQSPRTDIFLQTYLTRPNNY